MMRRARRILSAELLFAIVSVTVNALDAIIKKIDGGS